MTKTFKGRPLLSGHTQGEALVSLRGFNSLASFYKSMLTGADKALCSDQDNRDLHQKNLTGKVICLPKTIGSTSAGATWDMVAHMGIAPKAMLFSEKIDSLAAAGLFIADIWVGKRIYAVDQLGDDFLQSVHDGDIISIGDDGIVVIH